MNVTLKVIKHITYITARRLAGDDHFLKPATTPVRFTDLARHNLIQVGFDIICPHPINAL
jgi:hypothetical protein